MKTDVQYAIGQKNSNYLLLSSIYIYLCFMDEIVKSVRDFNRFYVNLIGLLKNKLFDLDYSLTESRILFEIDIHKQITARKLRELIAIDEGYLSRLISNLVTKKLIAKVQSSTDKRNYNLSLTEHGQNLIELINSKSDEQIAGLLRNINDKDKQRVAEIMIELKDILGVIAPK